MFCKHGNFKSLKDRLKWHPDAAETDLPTFILRRPALQKDV